MVSVYLIIVIHLLKTYPQALLLPLVWYTKKGTYSKTVIQIDVQLFVIM